MDPNNRPGGPNLVLTAKSADKIQFFDAATLTLTGELDMPGSTHEMVHSPDGKKVFASVYGGGIFGKNKDPDRRIAVLAIDPFTDKVERIAVGGSPHWIAISHATGKLFASFKTKEAVAVIDLNGRRVIGTIAIPHGAEGIAVAPDGETLFVCAHRKGLVHVIDTRTHALRQSLAIAGALGEANQLRRVRVSPDGRYVCASSHVDGFAVVYAAVILKQIAGFATPKAPMGFGFAGDGRHAYLCCHDAAITLEFELASGCVTRQFPTAAGCEFIVAY